MTATINKIVAGYKNILDSAAATGKKARFIVTNSINDEPGNYRDSIHYVQPGKAYGRWMEILKPYFINRLPAATPADSVIIDSLAPTANAGVDQTLRASTKYCRINASLSRAINKTRWLSSVTWTQLSGRTQFTYIDDAGNPANKANVKLFTTDSIWATGIYIFRCKVVDNKGSTSYDDVTISLTPLPDTIIVTPPVDTVIVPPVDTVIVVPPVDTVVIPPVDTTIVTPADPFAPFARAGADQTLKASTKYCRLNASTSSAINTSRWLASVTWTQMSGSTPFTYIDDAGNPANKANVRLTTTDSTWAKGVYIFRCKVVDNKGSISYDEVQITLN